MNYQQPKLLAQGVELYPDGTLLLTRCPKCGKENYGPNVISGICTWCGFNGRSLIQETNDETVDT